MPEVFEKEYTREILRLLLSEENKGIRLPMASTILRFKNPSIYQIIDQRVYRLFYGESLKLPTYNSEAAREKQVKMYLDYLGDLRKACTRFSIPFEVSDRDFYKADKRLNKGKRLANYGSGKG